MWRPGVRVCDNVHGTAQVRLMLLTWRILSCGCRPELAEASSVHPHVKHLIRNQELPAYYEESLTSRSFDLDAQLDDEEDAFMAPEMQSLPQWMSAVRVQHLTRCCWLRVSIG